MKRPYRNPTSVILGVVAFVVGYIFLFPTGCNEPEGVSSWDRCVTVVGIPAFSLSDWGLAKQFDILIPLTLGILVGGLTWWLSGPRTDDPEP